VTEFPWISTPVGVISKALTVKKEELTVTVGKNGIRLFSVKTPGSFDLELLNIAGKTVFHKTSVGPQSLAIERGMIHNGTYIARIISGGKNFKQKIVIAL
jgi:hypothetical protein